jgi:hypothetical protein
MNTTMASDAVENRVKDDKELLSGVRAHIRTQRSMEFSRGTRLSKSSERSCLHRTAKVREISDARLHPPRTPSPIDEGAGAHEPSTTATPLSFSDPRSPKTPAAADSNCISAKNFSSRMADSLNLK